MFLPEDCRAKRVLAQITRVLHVPFAMAGITHHLTYTTGRPQSAPVLVWQNHTLPQTTGLASYEARPTFLQRGPAGVTKPGPLSIRAGAKRWQIPSNSSLLCLLQRHLPHAGTAIWNAVFRALLPAPWPRMLPTTTSGLARLLVVRRVCFATILHRSFVDKAKWLTAASGPQRSDVKGIALDGGGAFFDAPGRTWPVYDKGDRECSRRS